MRSSSFGRFAVLAVLAGGCSVPSSGPSSGDNEPLGTSTDALTGTDAVSRAMEWSNAKLLYCQSPNHASDTIDPACPAVCNRTNNTEWDPYRSDCSGLVSWAWGLPAPGRTTYGFAPFQTDITHAITATSLKPGDAVNNSDHVMLFKAWVTPGSKATFIEEPGCSANPNYAHEFTSSVTTNGTSITVSYNGMTFTAIHYDGLTATPPPCHANGIAGECIDKSVCATKPGYKSTAGLCPGPTDEECCTPPPPPPTTGSTSSSHASSATSSSGHTTGATTGGGTSAGNASGGNTSGGSTDATTGSGNGSGGGGGAGGASAQAIKGSCQMSPSEPSREPLGVALAVGLFLMRRRKRSQRS